jgi:hypothetical protein
VFWNYILFSINYFEGVCCLHFLDQCIQFIVPSKCI